MRKTDRDGFYKQDRSPYWYTRLPGENGRTRRVSTGCVRLEDAKLWRAKQIAGAPQVSRHITLGELMQLYAPHAAESKTSLERDTYSLRHLVKFFKKRNLYTTPPSEVTTYKNNRRSQGASPATINREIGLPSAAINWANKAHDLALPNPFSGQRYPVSQTPPRERFLSRDEARALLQAAEQSPAKHLADFVTLVLHTGLRKSELLGLEWSRVDMVDGFILFHAADQKGRRMSRIPLNKTALQVLRSRRTLAATHVFAHQDGTRIKDVKKAFNAAVKRAGIAHCTIHDLRRTAGSWLIQAGVGIEVVAEVLRHKDIHVTRTTYAFLLDENTRAAVEKLDGV